MNVQKLVKFFRSDKGFDLAMLINKINITAAKNGSCTALFKVDPEISTEEGVLAPGYTATVFDTVSSLGAMTLINNVHVSVNINLSYFGEAKIGENLAMETKVIKAGKSLLYIEGILKNTDSGDVLAKGSHVKYVMDKKLFD